MNLLEIRNLHLCYGDAQAVLRGVSLDVAEGEIVCLVGESGSGKSTLLRAIPGLLPPSARILSGDVLFDGHPTGRNWPILGRDVGLIFQHPAQFFDPICKIGTQFDEMLRAHGMHSRSERRKIAIRALTELYLPDEQRVLASYPFELSGGMMQRAALAMAMCLSPKLLLADEPTSALDALTQAQAVAQLIELNRRKGIAILLVTHDIAVAEALSDRIGVIYRGELVEFGAREQIIHFPRHPYTQKLLDSILRWEE